MTYWNKTKIVPSSDTNVFKFVFTNENAVAESVLYRYGSFEERTVICCSTQSGCPVGCRFCGAGDYFVRSLTTGEIIKQVTSCIAYSETDPRKVKRGQIMFMSMGEPMLNWKALKPALYKLRNMYPNFALLISTIGPNVGQHVWDDLIATALDIDNIGLQFSVHEVEKDKRDALIPFKSKLSLEELAHIGTQFYNATGRQAFFNYCAHDGNDSEFHAARLRELFHPRAFQCTISVICERDESVAASNQRQRDLATSFMSKMAALGFSCRTFDPAGQDDIGGGCGQLWFVQDWMATNTDKAKPSVGNGLEKVHTPTDYARKNPSIDFTRCEDYPNIYP